ncbi:uncharacterized protein B0T23DRAFT_173877 [Neurospora hispaniola]|uniref:Chromo domain-containing protein n=1 Tax=Neurospora hispaniola TaxID=588809 RepID=A0AAJ0I6G8_9PEZI|nr:hypothetical protein B0T23DRAFT_173877 [Neurospora hispaniola]
MFKNVGRRVSKDSTHSTPAVEDEDDNISLASTASVQHDPDEEFEVEDILLEEPDDDGQQVYLVKWERYPLEQCTWEPEDNLGDELIEMWREKQLRQEAGEEEPFDVREFRAAVNRAKKAKADRHRRRNAKRRKLGLPLTEPFDSSSSESDLDIVKAESSDESSDEALEQEEPVSTDDREPRSAQESGARPQSEQKPKQKIFKGIAQPVPKSAKTAATTRESTFLEPKPKASSKSSSKAPERPSPPQPSSSKPRPERNFVLTTGYQGTARKPVDKARPSTPNGLTRPLPQSTRTAPPIASRPTSAGVRKPLTAKRTAVKKMVSVNIFAAGKVRKPRQKLEKAMSDPTKDPKQFKMLSQRRWAEKKSRDTEDRPPDLSTANIQLFNIRQIPTERKISLSTTASSSMPILAPGGQMTRTQVDIEAENTAGLELSSDEPAPVNSQELSIRPRDPPRRKSALTKSKPDGGQPKERKSVRFVPDHDETTIPQERGQIDVDGMFVEPVHTTPTTPTNSTAHQRISSPDPPPATASAGESDDGVPRGNLNKRLLIAEIPPFEVTFHDVPRDTHQLWATHFGNQKSLEIRLSCFAETAVAKLKPPLFQKCLAKGPITSENKEAIEKLARQLKARLLGLYYLGRHYNLLIYPTKCEQWQTKPFGQEVATGLTAALCYTIFSSDIDCGNMLRPLSLPLHLPETNRKAVPTRTWLMRRLYKFDYNQLLPRKPEIPQIHKFFLAFPESGTGKATRSVVFQWLRSSNPACHIYISSQPGSWDAFRASVAESSGVVIIHETLMWSLRRFPKLSEYLVKKYDEYWCFTEPTEAYPLYPSMSLPESVPPGISQLTRILPFGTAILLTPSFLVSEPEHAREFLDWFLSRQSSSTFYYSLVTASNIHEYLQDLALECIDSRERWWNAGPSLGMTPIETQFEINLRGHSLDECDSRLQAGIIASELHRIRTRKLDSSGGMEEDHSPLIYADPSIDPNDEQSLVNWFGWWSTLRADQFRKFHVVGSCTSIGYPNTKKGIRTVRIPKYLKTTINDPDAVAEVVQDEASQNLQVPAHELPPSKPPSAARSLELTGPFKSDIPGLSNDRGETLKTFLFSNFCNSGPKPIMRFYGYPVTWADSEMARSYGDLLLKHNKTISDWFSYTWPFDKTFNTYMGLFYTISEEWDPQKPPQNPNPRWHPWLAIYRPVNADIFPYRRCEVIIWDPLARKRFPGSQAPLERELTYMQRRVIQYVREHCGNKNRGTYLDQVWLGGFNCPSECESPYPLDMALKFARTVMQDIREHLPPAEQRLPEKGFRKVLKEHPPALDTMNGGGLDSDDDVLMDVDSNGGWEDEDEDVRIIFHPPRGTKLSPGSRSKCTNRLYEEARLARARSSSDHMDFKFVPTLKWYEDQVAEGRGFEHINIQSWQDIFNIFQVGKAKGSKVTTAAIAAKAPLTRGDREGDVQMTG